MGVCNYSILKHTNAIFKSQPFPLPCIRVKIVIHKIGPWFQKDWGLLAYRIKTRFHGQHYGAVEGQALACPHLLFLQLSSSCKHSMVPRIIVLVQKFLYLLRLFSLPRLLIFPCNAHLKIRYIFVQNEFMPHFHMKIMLAFLLPIPPSFCLFPGSHRTASSIAITTTSFCTGPHA